MRVPTHYLNSFVTFAEAHGASRPELLKEAAVSQETLDDPEARIEYEQFKLLIQGAVARSGDPALGMRLAGQLPITTHGLLGYAAMSSETLEEALSFVTRFVPTRIPMLVAELSVNKGIATLGIEEAAVLGEVRATILETTVGALHATARFLTHGEFELEELRFPYEEPDYVEEYRSAFDCPLVFGADAMEMRFAARLLKTRLPLADETAKKLAAKRCEEELAAIESSDDLEQRIRVQLLKMDRLQPSLDDLDHASATAKRRHFVQSDPEQREERAGGPIPSDDPLDHLSDRGSPGLQRSVQLRKSVQKLDRTVTPRAPGR
ncbi:MAG: AraC family transcriptional regulator [Deltaproteobacteria bacterium]|nr:AraC family transcriptional regulator [Deltaproteobacteria bacterium]